MSRRILAAEEINQMIREEMRKHEDCAKVSLRSVYWHAPDITGCNWDVNMWEGDVTDALACKERIIAAVKALRTRFNVPEPN